MKQRRNEGLDSMISVGNNKKKILLLTQFAILLAIEAIVSFTPLGSLPAFGPIVATLGMIPVVITAILLGTGAGAAMGFLAGLFSLIVWTFMPPNPFIAFVFTPFYSIGEIQGSYWSIAISIVPRIMVGLVTGLSFNVLKKIFPPEKGKDALVYGISGCLGSLANTFLVLGGIVIFFETGYTAAISKIAEVSIEVAQGLFLGIIGGQILTSGIPEAIISAVAAYFVCKPIRKYLLNK